MKYTTRSEPILLPDWNINPAWTHEGGCRLKRQMTPTEKVIVDVVSDCIMRAIENGEWCRWEEALFDLDTAIELMPDHPIAHWNRAHALLAVGRYEEGFAEYEWRFRLLGDQSQQTGIRRWRGEPLLGKRVLISHEQGYGDTIMLSRYIPIFKMMCKEVSLALPPSLHRLFEQFNVEILKSEWQNPRHYDFHIPLFSALTYLAKGFENIPESPYLSARARKTEYPCIGIAWSGDRNHQRDKHRSIDIDTFLELLDYTGYTLYSLQSSELDDADRRNVLTINYSDWYETASLIMAMDHIVCVDTASAHLAGALGHSSVHIVVPYSGYWPWYMADTWYPGANVYRQNSPGDWASVFNAVNRRIRKCQ